MSEMTGKSAVLRRVQKIYPEITRDSPVLADIVSELKEKEYEGYQYEGADSSFELIIRKRVEGVEPFFDLISYKVLDELPYDNNHSATATIKIRVGSKVKIAASDGDGPVNALDKALREALAEFYPCLNEVRLIDYKVRVMEPKDATAARVRVLISSATGAISGRRSAFLRISLKPAGLHWWIPLSTSSANSRNRTTRLFECSN